MKITQLNKNVYIYKGIRFDSSGDGLKIQDAHSDHYDDITDKYIMVFNTYGFKAGCRAILLDRYKEYLDGVNNGIRKEIASKRNKNKYIYLKKLKLYYLNKYNEQNN